MSKESTSSHPSVARVGKYIMLDLLGEGAFGKVRLAVHESNGKEYAIKIMDKSRIKANELTLQVRREIAVMKAIRHPNIVNLHEVLTSSKNIYMVMDLVTGGELFDAVAETGRLTEARTRLYFQQLVDGISYCHTRRIFHRDIKPENLLLSGEAKQTLKITDFGLSSIKAQNAPSELLHTVMGSPHYIAPEIITSAAEGYDGAKVDVWASGVVLYGMLAGHLPFDEKNTKDLYKAIVHSAARFPPHFSYDVIKLLRAMLQKDPNNRPTMEQIKTFAWFKVDYEPAITPEAGKKLRSKLRRRSERGKKRKDSEKKAKEDLRDDEPAEEKPISQLFVDSNRNSSASSAGRSITNVASTPGSKSVQSSEQENVDPRHLFLDEEDMTERDNPTSGLTATLKKTRSFEKADPDSKDGAPFEMKLEQAESVLNSKKDTIEAKQQQVEKEHAFLSPEPTKPNVTFTSDNVLEDSSASELSLQKISSPSPLSTPRQQVEVSPIPTENEFTQSPLTPQVSRFSSAVSSVGSGPEEGKRESMRFLQESAEMKQSGFSDFISPVSENSEIFQSPKDGTKFATFLSPLYQPIKRMLSPSEDTTPKLESNVEAESVKPNSQIASKEYTGTVSAEETAEVKARKEEIKPDTIFRPMPSLFKALTEHASAQEAMPSMAPNPLCPEYDYDSDGVPRWCIDSMEVFADVDDNFAVQEVQTPIFRMTVQQRKTIASKDMDEPDANRPKSIFAPLDNDIAQKLSPGSGGHDSCHMSEVKN